MAGPGFTGWVAAAAALAMLVLAAPATAATAVWGWGSGESGVLGAAMGPEVCWGEFRCSTSPLEVPGLSSATSVAAGQEVNLALLEGGTVAAWGSNVSDQLGDRRSWREQAETAAPVKVSGLTGAVAVAAGDSSSMALLANGTVETWGENTEGQLGDGKTTPSVVPVIVKGVTHATAIAAGEGDSLALRSNGTVMAWGSNRLGQLGIGTRQSTRIPRQVKALTGVVAIAGGSEHNLALLANGTVKAWGSNEAGQLGVGSRTGPEPCQPTACAPTPVTVEGLSNVVAIAAGESHSLALLRNGTVMSWGQNDSGQLGDGSTEAAATPVQVEGVTAAVAIAAGSESSMALLEDGRVLTWGGNGEGELGDGAATGPERCEPQTREPCSRTPVEVTGMAGAVSQIAAGGLHDLALTVSSNGPLTKARRSR